MTRTSRAIALMALVLVHTCFAVQLRRTEQGVSQARRDQLEKAAAQSQFAHSLVQNVQLQLKQNNGRVDKVIELLQNALADTVQDQSDLQTQYTNEMERFDTLISSLRNDIRDLNSEFEQTVLRVSQILQEIDRLSQRVADLQQELTLLDEREQRIREARENDVQAFALRQKRDTRALEALDTLIPDLQDLLNQSQTDASLIQRKESDIRALLAKIPRGKSVQALVQVSTRFNRAQLATVLQQLEQIREQISTAKAEDEQNEAASSQRFEALIEQVERVRSDKARSLNTAQSELQQSENERDQAITKRNQLSAQISQNKEILDATVATQEVTDAQYKRRLADAQATVEAIRNVLKILSDNEEGLQGLESQTDSLVENSSM